MKSTESPRLLEGSSNNQELKGLSSTESSRLLEGSSSNQELKGLSSLDSNNWQQEGSSSNSQDSKRDHPFARSQLGTVKKASGVGSKPIGGNGHCYLNSEQDLNSLTKYLNGRLSCDVLKNVSGLEK